MASGNGFNISAVADVDLSALIGHFGVFTSTGTFTSGGTTLSAQGRVDGIVAEGVLAGQTVPVTVADGDIVKLKLGATVSALAQLGTAADGRAIVATGAGAPIFAMALEGGDADEIIRAQFAFKGVI